MSDVRYRPTTDADAWRIAVEDGALAALAPVVTDRVAEAVWRHVGTGGIGAVIDALTGAFGTSLVAIPPFALAVVEGGGVRVVVRGDLEVLVEDADGRQVVTGAGAATWVERHLPGARNVTVFFGETVGDPGALPLASGVVPASAVVLTLAHAASDPSPVPEPARVPEPASVPGPASVPELVEGSAAAPDDDAAAAAADAWDLPPTAPDTDEFPAVPADDATNAVDLVTAVPASDTVIPTATISATTVGGTLPGATTEPSPDHPEDPDFDLVWGATIAKRPPAVDGAADAAAPAPPVPPVAVLGDHDGETIAVADLRAMRQAERERYESTDNVPPRRPPQGRIRLSTGRVVELERPVVIGRRPKSTRASGAELPTLVAVDSPEQDISRSHVEIRTEGEHVLVTDLDTTNGTLLLRGGQDPVRLHPGEPTMVVSGDVLDIGDGVTVAFEDLP